MSDSVAVERARVRRLVGSLAAEQDGVVSRAQARQLGADRFVVRREVSAGRWRVLGNQTVVVHRARISRRARWRHTLFEAGAASALDGVTALEAAGLTGFDDDIHISLPRGYRHPRIPGVVVHETRRRADGDVVGSGIRRVRPDVAAIRAAMWARSDRAGATIMAMTVQQRFTTGARLLAGAHRVGSHRRRNLVIAWHWTSPTAHTR